MSEVRDGAGWRNRKWMERDIALYNFDYLEPFPSELGLVPLYAPTIYL